MSGDALLSADGQSDKARRCFGTILRPMSRLLEHPMKRNTQAVLLSVVGAACVSCQSPAVQQLPDRLRPAATEVVLQTLAASGVQIYQCQSEQDNPRLTGWAFVAPEADLFDAQGSLVGKHSAGPQWESLDGSRVVGTLKARVEAPQADAIAWLLLTARAEGRSGSFSRVTSIQRINTSGGNAPAASQCTPESLGQRARVPYSADYVMFGAK